MHTQEGYTVYRYDPNKCLTWNHAKEKGCEVFQEKEVETNNGITAKKFQQSDIDSK